MPDVPNRQSAEQSSDAGIFIALAAFGGLQFDHRAGYKDNQGFSLTPPPDWVERARGDAMSAQMVHKQANIPLPPLDAGGKSPGERLVVRYDRVSYGSLAWLRVSLAEVPSSVGLKTWVATKTPAANWKRESEVEELEIGGLPAARIAVVGRWNDQDELCETVAVRKGERVYVITGSLPAADAAAREQVRQAVASAVWQ